MTILRVKWMTLPEQTFPRQPSHLKSIWQGQFSWISCGFMKQVNWNLLNLQARRQRHKLGSTGQRDAEGAVNFDVLPVCLLSFSVSFLPVSPTSIIRAGCAVRMPASSGCFALCLQVSSTWELMSVVPSGKCLELFSNSSFSQAVPHLLSVFFTVQWVFNFSGCIITRLFLSNLFFSCLTFFCEFSVPSYLLLIK